VASNGYREEPPPFLGTWKRVYIAVLLYLVAVITLFYLFTQAYSR
jgi:hypothetical protein